MMKRIAQALGFAAILLLPSYIDLTSSLGDERMHVPRPLTRIALAQLVDLAIVALLFSGLIAVLRRRKSWPKIRWALLAVLPVYLLLRNLNLLPFNVPLAAVLALSIAWFIALALLIFRAPVFAVRLYNIGSAVLAGFAVFGLVVSWQLVRAAMWRPGPQAFSSSIPAQPPARPRIIWILFDELAYKPVFEARDPSLELPNFDRLRSQSTLYTQVDTHRLPDSVGCAQSAVGAYRQQRSLFNTTTTTSSAPLIPLTRKTSTPTHRSSAWRKKRM